MTATREKAVKNAKTSKNGENLETITGASKNDKNLKTNFVQVSCI